MTINNTTYVMVEDGGTQTLASASTSASASGSKGTRSAYGEGMMPSEGMTRGEGMSGAPDMGGAPDMSGEAGAGRSGKSRQETASVEEEAVPQTTQKSFFSGAVDGVKGLYAKLMAWLYAGAASSAETVTGSLVQVTVGMQNDDYAEILSGVSAGQTVLYTATSSSSSSSGWNTNGRGGGNMGGMPMMGF